MPDSSDDDILQAAAPPPPDNSSGDEVLQAAAPPRRRRRRGHEPVHAGPLFAVAVVADAAMASPNVPRHANRPSNCFTRQKDSAIDIGR